MRSRVPALQAAAASLRSSGWDVPAAGARETKPDSGGVGGDGAAAWAADRAPSASLRGGGRRNCEFVDLRSPAIAPSAAAYVAAIKSGGRDSTGGPGGIYFWVPLVRDFAPRIGLFGLASLAFETVTTVPHVVLHVMGIIAAEHAGSLECRSAGGGATDLCVT
eukprot:scaffold16595_cov86-Isochrysis_galbana.AAC.2